MACYVDDVIKIARAEVGYLEKASNSNLDSKTGNAGSKNYTKYARDLDKIAGFYNGKKQGYAWCDVFVDWCFVKAYGVDNAKKLLCQPDKSLGAGCEYSMRYYKSKKQLYTSPKAGDQIFFKDAEGDVIHTGIVYKVDNTYVYTVEGNTSSSSGVVANGGCVREKKYKLSYNRIAGYGRPAYDVKKETTTTKETSKDYQCIHTVVKGDRLWDIAKKYLGSGSRYTEIMSLNGKTSETITVGEKLKIPFKDKPAEKEYQCIHTVVDGDTPWNLAKKYLGSGAKYTKIMSLNGKKSTDSIYVGEQLKIPNK